MKFASLNKPLAIAGALAAGMLLPELAMADTGGAAAAMPWDSPLEKIQNALVHGTAPKVIGLAFAAASLGVLAGDTGGLTKKAGIATLAGGLALAGPGLVNTIFGSGALF